LSVQQKRLEKILVCLFTAFTAAEFAMEKEELAECVA
jgi:hypothetical protein